MKGGCRNALDVWIGISRSYSGAASSEDLNRCERRLRLARAAPCRLEVLACSGGLGERPGGGYSFEENTFYGPLAEEARRVSQVEDCDICMFGDSLTMYGLWQEFLPGSSVVNRGIGGDVSEGALDRVDTVISANPDKVFLMIGTNDVAHGIDHTEVLSNVSEIVSILISELPSAEIYVQSILPRGDHDYKEQIVELNKGYSRICEDAASKGGRVSYLDISGAFLGEDGALNGGLYAADLLHLNADGYETWLEAICQHL